MTGSGNKSKRKECLAVCRMLFLVRLAAHVSNGCKSLIRPSSGKDIAKTKGVLFIAMIMINARGI